jgi:hypothetical protein
MKLTRTLKRLISLAMIGMLFFAQMSMAAYVCPAQAGSMPAMENMLGCEGMQMAGMGPAAMDMDSPSLCHASCNSGEQSAQTFTVHLPVATLSSLPFVVLPAPPVALLSRAVPASPSQSVAASPPLSVLYCCFRI